MSLRKIKQVLSHKARLLITIWYTERNALNISFSIVFWWNKYYCRSPAYH